VCVVFATRLVPLLFSPLPFGIDGFALARISSDIGASGAWRIDSSNVNSYNQKLPGFSFVWSAVASLGGLSPLAYVQLVMPLLAALSVIPAYLLGVKATGRRLGGFVAGLFVTFFGSFLLLTSSVSKESLGLLIFPVVVLMFLERRDPRKRALSVVLVVFLAFLHPLTTLLTLGMISALVVLDQRRAITRGRFRAGRFAFDLATGPALAILPWTYYSAVNLPFLGDLLAADALVLFLGIVILMTALIAPMGRPATLRLGQRFVSPLARGILVPAIGVLVVLGNARNGLFAGAIGTQSGLLQMLPAIGVLSAFALAGYQLVRRTTNRANDLARRSRRPHPLRIAPRPGSGEPPDRLPLRGLPRLCFRHPDRSGVRRGLEMARTLATGKGRPRRGTPRGAPRHDPDGLGHARGVRREQRDDPARVPRPRLARVVRCPEHHNGPATRRRRRDVVRLLRGFVSPC